MNSLPVPIVTGALALGTAALARDREAGAAVPHRGVFCCADDVSAGDDIELPLGVSWCGTGLVR